MSDLRCQLPHQKQIGERLRKSKSWVNRRLSVALDIIKEVQNAIGTGVITINQAVIISQLPKNRQGKFLDFVIAKQRELDRKLSADETRFYARTDKRRRYCSIQG